MFLLQLAHVRATPISAVAKKIGGYSQKHIPKWESAGESLGFGLVKMYDNYFSGFWGIRTNGYILHIALATGFQRQDQNIGCHAPKCCTFPFYRKILPVLTASE